MTWTMSSGIDVSHWQTIADYERAKRAIDWVQIKLTEGTVFTDPGAATHHRGFDGIPRGAYHFARPSISTRDQVAYFLARKAEIGAWERPDMLDAETAGTTAGFVKALIAEYRRQSGRHLVLVYSPVDPAGWWDEGCVIWRARYRRIGAPKGPDDWARHLGWDHLGLGIYQWDDQWPLPGGPLVDINSQRVSLAEQEDEDEMAIADIEQAFNNKIADYQKGGMPGLDGMNFGRAVAELYVTVAGAYVASGKPLGELIAEIANRPAADVDEVALADALAERGLLKSSVSKQDVSDALREVFAAAAGPTEATLR